MNTDLIVWLLWLAAIAAMFVTCYLGQRYDEWRDRREKAAFTALYLAPWAGRAPGEMGGER